MVYVELLKVTEDLLLDVLDQLGVIPDLLEPGLQISPITIAIDLQVQLDVVVLCAEAEPMDGKIGTSCERTPARDRALSAQFPGHRVKTHKNVNVCGSIYHRPRSPLEARDPPVLTDLVEVAAYVYCADQAVTRGGDGVVAHGRDWRRSFSFHIPVRAMDVWSSEAVRTVLRDTLGFLSDDEYEFHFYGYKNPVPMQSYLELAPGAEGINEIDEVLPFSGGADSMGGAAAEAVRDGRRIVLVSHRANPKISSKQKLLVEDLRARCAGNKPIHIPVWVQKGLALDREYTQRTRSFLYAALAAVVALAFGRRRIRFYENGVVSLNLPISEQVIGARATRTTHPQVLSGYASLFGQLTDGAFEVENRFLWLTKSEVVDLIGDVGCAEFIKHSVSCTHTRDMTQMFTHCGVCSQCVNRNREQLAEYLKARRKSPAGAWNSRQKRISAACSTTRTLRGATSTRVRACWAPKNSGPASTGMPGCGSLRPLTPRRSSRRSGWSSRKAQIEVDYLARVHEVKMRLFDLETSRMVLEEEANMNRLGYRADEIKARIAELTQQRDEIRQVNQEATDAAVDAARQNAANRTAAMVRDHNRQLFDTSKRQAEGVFDALLTKSQSIWSAIGNSLKTALLTAIKDVVTSRVAAMLMQLFTGQKVSFASGGSGGGGVLGGIGGMLGVGAVPVFGGGGGPIPGGSAGGWGTPRSSPAVVLRARPVLAVASADGERWRQVTRTG